jgi:hypothetical protein
MVEFRPTISLMTSDLSMRSRRAPQGKSRKHRATALQGCHKATLPGKLVHASYLPLVSPLGPPPTTCALDLLAKVALNASPLVIRPPAPSQMGISPSAQPDPFTFHSLVLHAQGDMVQTTFNGERLIGMVDGIFTHADSVEPIYGVRFIDRVRKVFRAETFAQSQLESYVPLWDTNGRCVGGAVAMGRSRTTHFVPAPTFELARNTPTPP